MTSNNKNMETNEWAKYDDSKDDSISVYNEMELNYLDKFLPLVQNAFDENELYEIIVDCNFEDKLIEKTINEKIRYLKAKGSQYGWNVVDKNHRLKPVTANSNKVDNEENKNNKLNKVSEKKVKVSKSHQNKKKPDNYSYNQNNYYRNYEDDNLHRTYDDYNNYTYDNNYSYYNTSKKNNYNKNYSRNYNYSYNDDYYNDYSNYNQYYKNNYDNYSSRYYYDDNNYESKYKKKRRPDTLNLKNKGQYYNGIKPYNKNEKRFYSQLVEISSDYNLIKHETQPLTNSMNNTEINFREDINNNAKGNIDNSITNQQTNLVHSSINEHFDNTTALNQSKKENITEKEKLDLNKIEEKEFEEINVNKTDVENLRGYFERLKQNTIFNENQNSRQNTANGIYEQLSKFTGVDITSSIPVFQVNNLYPSFKRNEQQEQNIDSSQKNLINKSISNTNSINNLIIQQPQLLQFSSDRRTSGIECEGQNIEQFSLSILGKDKKQKKEEGINNPYSTTNTSVTVNNNSNSAFLNQNNPTYYNNMNTNQYENNYQQLDYSQVHSQSRYNPYMNMSQPDYPQEGFIKANEVYHQNPLEYSYTYNYYPFQIPTNVYRNLNYGNYQERYNYQSPQNLQEMYHYYPRNPQGVNYISYQPQFNQQYNRMNNNTTNMNSKIEK